MNDYFYVGKNPQGKKLVSIKCNDCNIRVIVRKQTAHDRRLYYCKNCSRLGERNPMYGNGHRISGEKNGNFGGLTETHKKNLSVAKTGTKLNLSDEAREKKRIIGGNNLKKWMNENPDMHRETSRKGGVNSLKLQSQYNRISSIEHLTILWLKKNNIEYEFQYDIDHKFLYDFRINDIIIEVNGDWFHSQPEQVKRDAIKRQLAESKGFKVVYIWEHEIRAGNFSKLEDIFL